MKKIIILTALIISAAVYVGHLKSEINYADIDCPICGGDEVLDFGTDDSGAQKCHCADCGVEFIMYDEF